ncbi:YbaY family lipoprotein [Caenispirillum salinarum]|uniref:YbaY family lipoprotein n=1 Tax=Caenispirillum salinarum TaxID=859058 RepID=UPI00384C9159
MSPRRAGGALLVGMLASAVAGCAGGGPAPAPPQPVSPPFDAAGASLGPARPAVDPDVVQGALVYREPVVLPPEALARVQLVRLGPGRTPRGVLATAWVAGPMAPPVPFRLTWDPRSAAPLAPGERLAVVAMVMVADEVLFTSLAPAAYTSPAEPVVVPLLARWGGVEV